MTKKVLAAILGSMLISSAAMAAPVADLAKGESQAGYNFSKLEFSLDSFSKSTGVNGFYYETGISDKLTLGLDYNDGDVSKTVLGNRLKLEETQIDFYGQYKLDKNAKLILGVRNYDETASVNGNTVGTYDSTKALYGIALNTALGKNTTGYTALLGTSEETEWRIGAAYQLDKQTVFDVNYKHKDYDGPTTLEGWGLGLSYRF